MTCALPLHRIVMRAPHVHLPFAAFPPPLKVSLWPGHSRTNCLASNCDANVLGCFGVSLAPIYACFTESLDTVTKVQLQENLSSPHITQQWPSTNIR
eukprot:3915439-Rhodomonas_salina.2